jgi:hypothetical protein
VTELIIVNICTARWRQQTALEGKHEKSVLQYSTGYSISTNADDSHCIKIVLNCCITVGISEAGV